MSNVGDAHKRRGRRKVNLDEDIKVSCVAPRGAVVLPWWGKRVGTVPELPARPPGRAQVRRELA